MEDLLREDVDVDSEGHQEDGLQEEDQQHGEEAGGDEVGVVQLPLQVGGEEAVVGQTVQLDAGDDHQDGRDGGGGEDHRHDTSERSSANIILNDAGRQGGETCRPLRISPGRWLKS